MIKVGQSNLFSVLSVLFCGKQVQLVSLYRDQVQFNVKLYWNVTAQKGKVQIVLQGANHSMKSTNSI